MEELANKVFMKRKEIFDKPMSRGEIYDLLDFESVKKILYYALEMPSTKCSYSYSYIPNSNIICCIPSLNDVCISNNRREGSIRIIIRKAEEFFTEEEIDKLGYYVISDPIIPNEKAIQRTVDNDELERELVWYMDYLKVRARSEDQRLEVEGFIEELKEVENEVHKYI